MSNMILTFKKSTDSNDWRCTDADAALCGGGLKDYVEIPEHIKEFQAVFSPEEPEKGDYFCIEEPDGDDNLYHLDTDNGIEFYENASNLLRSAFYDGYRFIEVRY